MSPFLRQNDMDSLAQNEFGDDGNCIVYDSIMDQIAETRDSLDEGKQLTDNKKLQEKLLLQDVKIESLKQTLDMKAKQLQELNELLKRKKTEIGQLKHQRSQNFDVIADVFKDTKKFSSKAGHEISQTFASLGFDIEFDQIDDLAVVKIQKDGKLFKFGLNDHLRLTLIDMSPKHSRFEDIKVLFDDTRDLSGLFSIYNWSVGDE